VRIQRVSGGQVLKGNQAQGRIGFRQPAMVWSEQRTRWWSNASRARSPVSWPLRRSGESVGVAGQRRECRLAGRTSVRQVETTPRRRFTELVAAFGQPRGTSHRLSGLCAGRQQCRSGWPRGFVPRMPSVGLHREIDCSSIGVAGEPQGCQRVRLVPTRRYRLRGRSCGCPRALIACDDCVSTSFRARFHCVVRGNPAVIGERAAPPQTPRRGSFPSSFQLGGGVKDVGCPVFGRRVAGLQSRRRPKASADRSGR